MNGKHKWLVETIADYGYPMEIKGGAFLDDKGEVLAGIPADMYLAYKWWSNDSGSIVAGDEYRPLPSKMSIRWFSYAEDKFYEGTFALDHRKIEEEFKKDYICLSGTENYNAIKVALAPGGQVFLYLTGSNIALLGSYQAQERMVTDFKEEMGIREYIKITRKELLAINIAKMPLLTQQEIKEGKIRTDIWKNINLKYPWRYTFEIIDYKRPLKFLKDNQRATYISGEQTWCRFDDAYFTSPVLKAVPLKIDSDFETAAGRKLKIHLYIGYVNGIEPKKQDYEIRRAREQELVKLFKDFYEKTGKQEFDLHLKISDNLQTGKVYLKKGNIEQEIPNVQVEIEDATFD